MDSTDLTLDRWLQTVSDEEAIRALTHALAVVKVRAELRLASAPMPTPMPAPAPVLATSMGKPSLEQALSVQLQPGVPAAQSRIVMPVAEASVEVATAHAALPSVVIDELQNTKPLASALTEATQSPVVAVETHSSVASTFNRATAKTLVPGERPLGEPLDPSTMGRTMQFGTITPVPTAMLSEPAALEPASMGKTMQFGTVSPVFAETAASTAKTVVEGPPSSQALMPRRDSLDEALLVPQRNKLAVAAMLAAGALLLVGLVALVAAVLSPSEPVAVVAPKEDEDAPRAAVVAAPKAVEAAMTAQQTEEAIARARAAVESAAETKRVAAEEETEKVVAAKPPAPGLEPVAEAKKPARTVTEPISGERAPAPIVAVSPRATVPAPAPAPMGAPKSVAAPAPVAAKTTVAPAPVMATQKHAVTAPAPAPAPRRSQSADPLDSRR